jgi:ferric-dicitrate binding protein FerR (iron transport regulator)
VYYHKIERKDMQYTDNYRELIIKFLGGEITEAETELLKIWLEKDPSSRRIFDRENELWQESAVKTKLEYYRTDNAWNDLSAKLGLGKNRSNQVFLIRKNNFRILVAAAAMTGLIAVGSIALWQNDRGSVKQYSSAVTAVSTGEGEKARIWLPDSTRVILNSESVLRFPSDFNANERIVNFTGEAFFNVKTEPEKPFEVRLGRMTVSATGTKFNILSYKNENRIETTLEEGKIKVKVGDKGSIDLKPGQQLVYFLNTDTAVVRDVVTETYTSWKENKLRLVDTPFEEALRRIARRYNVTFEIRGRELLELKYTATFIDESIEEVMQMLKAVSPITYRIYNRTSADDRKYLKPKIVVGMKKYSRL